MKRLLILFALLAALMLTQTAVASPYAFGPSVFDEGWNITWNIERLIEASGTSGASLQNGPANLDSGSIYNFTLIAYSQYVADSGGVAIYNGNNLINNASTFYHIGGYLPGDLVIEYVEGNFGLVEQMLFSELKNGVTLENGSIGFDLSGFGDGVGYYFAEGTIFFGYSILGSNTYGPDFIIAAAPITSAVPVPAAAWLLGSGLAGLGVLRRKLR